MNKAVQKLLYFRLRGGIRQRFREIRSIRGLLYVGVIILFVVFIWRSFSAAQLLDPSTASELAQKFLPAGLLAGCLLSALSSSGPALYFNHAEQNLLFSAPVTRWNLVLYKIASYASSATLTSLLLAVILPPVLGLAVFTFLATLITLLFIQLMSAAINLSLLYCRKKPSLFKVGKQLMFLLLSIAGVWLAYSFSNHPETVVPQLERLVELDAVRIVLAPFNLVSALHFPLSSEYFFTRTLLTGIMIVGLIGIIISLDQKLIEESLSLSLSAQQNWQRILRTGIIWKNDVIPVRSRKVPPRLGGFGPIAWQQLQRALRTSSTTILILIIIAAACGPLLAIKEISISNTSRAASLFFLAVFILPRFLIFDFRTSQHTLHYFKTLPVPSFVICLGQVVVPTLLTTGIELVMLLTAAPFLSVNAGLMIFAIPMVFVFNLVLYLVENIIFLLFPSRLVPVGRMDFDFMGRTLGEFLVKSVVLAAVFGLAISLALKFGKVFSTPDIAIFSTLLAVPLIASLVMVYILARAYDRYDVTFQPN